MASPREDPEMLNELEENEESPVSTQQVISFSYISMNHAVLCKGHDLAEELNCKKYIECSSVNQEGLKDVFDEAIREFLLADKDDSKCIVL